METSLADQRIPTAAMTAAEMAAPDGRPVAARTRGRWVVDLRTGRVVFSAESRPRQVPGEHSGRSEGA